MKSWAWQFIVVGSLVLGGQAAQAAGSASLNDWCVNVSGDTSSCNGSAGSNPNVDLSAFDTTLSPGTNTLGTVTVNLTNASNAYVNLYTDYDVDQPTYGSFLDYGTVNGSAPAGVSYSINDPGATGASLPTGFTLFDQFANNTLDGVNYEPVGSFLNNPPDVCCDVAVGLGIGGLNGTGAVTFTISTTAPTGGFYIQQTNGVAGDSIYYTVASTVSGPGGPSTPEPSTFALGLGALGAVIAVARAKRSRA